MKYFERAELGRPGFNQCAMSDRRKPYRRFARMQRGSSKSGCTKARLERIPKDPGQGEQCEGREIPGLTLEGAVLDIRINQATQIAPVILSGAPQRFVSYQDHWRGVEGPRECVIYHTMSGSSHEIAIAPRCGRGVKKSHCNQFGRSYERLLAAEQSVRIRVITVDIRRISGNIPTITLHQPHKLCFYHPRLDPRLHSSFSRK